MVKNISGGNKSKGKARKYAAVKPSGNSLRTAENEYELYGNVIKMLGDGMCHVLNEDGKTRLCFIRGKFRSHGKRDNMVCLHSWVLVGLREWASKPADNKKLEQCDLLEVYNDIEKERLKNTILNVNWGLFSNSITSKEDATTEEIDELHFISNKEEEYYDLINNEIQDKKGKKIIIFQENEEEIDIDDI
jgi:hypothetical protein